MQKQSAVIPFSFQSHEIRTTIDKNGDPWFVAVDVCDILGLKNPAESLKALPDDERDKKLLGRKVGEANIISESGLYRLIFRSNKPEAEVFRKWVFSEVLPAIRKTGKYQVEQAITPAQQCMLQQAIKRRFPFGEDLPYAWGRFNNHFRLGSYKQLPAAKIDEALRYIETIPETVSSHFSGVINRPHRPSQMQLPSPPAHDHLGRFQAVTDDGRTYLALSEILAAMGKKYTSYRFKVAQAHAKDLAIVVTRCRVGKGAWRKRACIPADKLNLFLQINYLTEQFPAARSLPVPISRPTTFHFGGSPLRAFCDNDARLWFSVTDLAALLGHTSLDRLAALSYWRTNDVMIDGRMVSFISESDLYRFLARSKNQNSFGIEEWVASQVAPALRASLPQSENQNDLLALADIIKESKNELRLAMEDCRKAESRRQKAYDKMRAVLRGIDSRPLALIA